MHHTHSTAPDQGENNLHNLFATLQDYETFNTHEAADKQRILDALETYGLECFNRQHNPHFTATALLVAEGHVLLLYNAKMQRWLPPGGHAEGQTDLPAEAQRELWEETRISAEMLKSALWHGIADVDNHAGERKPGVAEHSHLNITFGWVLPRRLPFISAEGMMMRWWSFTDILTPNEPMRRLKEKLKTGWLLRSKS